MIDSDRDTLELGRPHIIQKKLLLHKRSIRRELCSFSNYI